MSILSRPGSNSNGGSLVNGIENTNNINENRTLGVFKKRGAQRSGFARLCGRRWSNLAECHFLPQQTFPHLIQQALNLYCLSILDPWLELVLGGGSTVDLLPRRVGKRVEGVLKACFYPLSVNWEKGVSQNLWGRPNLALVGHERASSPPDPTPSCAASREPPGRGGGGQGAGSHPPAVSSSLL